MPLTIKKKPATAEIETIHKHQSEVVTEQHDNQQVALPVNLEPGPQESNAAPLATIGVQTSMTINLGKFNSVKVGVTLNVPSELHSLDEVFDFATSWVNAKMSQLVSEVSPEEQPAD